MELLTLTEALALYKRVHGVSLSRITLKKILADDQRRARIFPNAQKDSANVWRIPAAEFLAYTPAPRGWQPGRKRK